MQHVRGEGIEGLRETYNRECESEIPGRSIRLLALLELVMERANFHSRRSDAVARELYGLARQITMELRARARRTRGPELPLR